MAMQAHLVELERKHKILENELHEALVHLSTDDLQIVELKRRKLMVKDEIERLRAYGQRNTALDNPSLTIVYSLRIPRQPCLALMRRVIASASRPQRSVPARGGFLYPRQFADVIRDRQR